MSDRGVPDDDQLAVAPSAATAPRWAAVGAVPSVAAERSRLAGASGGDAPSSVGVWPCAADCVTTSAAVTATAVRAVPRPGLRLDRRYLPRRDLRCVMGPSFWM